MPHLCVAKKSELSNCTETFIWLNHVMEKKKHRSSCSHTLGSKEL